LPPISIIKKSVATQTAKKNGPRSGRGAGELGVIKSPLYNESDKKKAEGGAKKRWYTQECKGYLF